jgi:hypothetical protein
MAQTEAARPDGIEAIVIVTPNHLHAPIATAFPSRHRCDCDKPLSTTLAEAEGLQVLARENRRFVVTLNNTGYAMVRQARDGCCRRARRIVSVHAAYIQDWLTLPIDAQARRGRMAHRFGTRRAVGGAGRHRRACFNLASFIPATPRPYRLIFTAGRAPVGRQRACAGALTAGRAARSWQARHRQATTTFGSHLWRQGRARMVGHAAENCAARRRKRARLCGGHGRPRKAEGRACRPRTRRLYRGHPYRDAANIIRAHRPGFAVDRERQFDASTVPAA